MVTSHPTRRRALWIAAALCIAGTATGALYLDQRPADASGPLPVWVTACLVVAFAGFVVCAAVVVRDVRRALEK